MCAQRMLFLNTIKGQEWIYYYGDRFTEKLADLYLGDQVVDGRSEYYQYPMILKEEIPDVPDWFKNAVVYNIFPDSFASGKRSLKETGEEKYLVGRYAGRNQRKSGLYPGDGVHMSLPEPYFYRRGIS